MNEDVLADKKYLLNFLPIISYIPSLEEINKVKAVKILVLKQKMC